MSEREVFFIYKNGVQIKHIWQGRVNGFCLMRKKKATAGSSELGLEAGGEGILDHSGRFKRKDFRSERTVVVGELLAPKTANWHSSRSVMSAPSPVGIGSVLCTSRAIVL